MLKQVTSASSSLLVFIKVYIAYNTLKSTLTFACGTTAGILSKCLHSMPIIADTMVLSIVGHILALNEHA